MGTRSIVDIKNLGLILRPSSSHPGPKLKANSSVLGVAVTPMTTIGRPSWLIYMKKSNFSPKFKICRLMPG